jgi:hypothetical protein
LLIYGIAALVLTWPLAAHFTTHMPGDGIDDPSLGWNLWWIKQRLVDQLDLDIFHVGWMFHPVEINLAFYTLTPLNGLLSIPLQTAFGLVIANNVVLFSSFVLAGFGCYLLVLSLLGDWRRLGEIGGGFYPSIHLAALFAGFVYAFASSKLFYAALGQYNIASSQWIPFCVLYVLRIGRSTSLRPALRNSALAALFLTFQAWAELTYASFLILFIVIYFLWIATARLRSLLPNPYSLLPLFLPFLILAALFLAGLTPFLWAMLPDLRSEGDFFTSGGGFSDAFSADLAGYLVPTRLHPWLGDWVATLPFPNDVGQQIYIGYSVSGLALLGGWFLLQKSKIQNPKSKIQNPAWFWIASTHFFWWMTLGPRLRWLGQETPISGPFALISLLPFFNGNRYPSRYSVMLMLGVAVLAGFGLYTVLGYFSKRRLRDLEIGRFAVHSNLSISKSLNLQPVALTLIVAALMLLEHLSLPLPLNDFRIPPIYQTLAQQPDDFAVLELPTGWRNGARVLGRSDKLIMMQQWYQTLHGKRRLGGNTSRNPPHKFQYFTNAPLLGDLIALMNADRDYMQPAIDAEFDTIVARNRPIAGQVLADLGVEWVTVHVEKSPPALLRFVDEVLPLTLTEEWHGTDWEGQPNTIRLYEVHSVSPAPVWEENLAATPGQLYLGAGWSSLADGKTRYATRPQAELLLNLPSNGGRLELELFGPAPAIALRINGQAVGSASLTPGADGNWLSLEIPPGVADEPVDRVQLYFEGPLTPIAALTNSLALLVQSAGEDVGDFAHIWVNGQDAAVGGRGYNLVAVDQSGNVLASAVFDTHASSAASVELAAWLAQWPLGTTVAGAVMDEASYNLQAEAVDALAGLGVAGDLRGRFRWGHAFIGVVGAPAGSALESFQLLQPATVYVGAPVDGEVVSGGVGRVRILNQ